MLVDTPNYINLIIEKFKNLSFTTQYLNNAIAEFKNPLKSSPLYLILLRRFLNVK